jgi:RNA polymerase sigma factor (sigma-70 family)
MGINHINEDITCIGNTAAGAEGDAVLITAVRRGDVAAYGILYQRHLRAARRAAAAFAPNWVERDDLVAESFAQVLRVLRAGCGPNEKFWPYLLTTMRNAVVSRRRRDSPLSLVAEVPDTPPHGHDDPASTRTHALVAAAAFAQLPRRWQLVLWYTEIEDQSPTEAAELLGLSPNGVAALAYRARKALRQAYLGQYVPTAAPSRTCQTVVEQLPGWIRHTSTVRTTQQIIDHLNGCTNCRNLATDLGQLNQQLPRLPIPHAVDGTPSMKPATPT